MQSGSQPIPVAKPMVWAGRIVTALVAAFLLLDGVAKLFKPAPVVEATLRLGFPENGIVGLGIVLIVSVIIYLIPQTSVLGAILVTGYLGGAVAAHLRVGEGLFPVVFPVIFGMLVWGGVWLRDARVRALIPLKSLR